VLRFTEIGERGVVMLAFGTPGEPGIPADQFDATFQRPFAGPIHCEVPPENAAGTTDEAASALARAMKRLRISICTAGTSLWCAGDADGASALSEKQRVMESLLHATRRRHLGADVESPASEGDRPLPGAL
jgi:hypothetical protein